EMKDKTSSLVISLALLLSLTAPFTALAQKDHKLEVFSWWTSGGEAAALNALFQDYKERDPGVQLVLVLRPEAEPIGEPTPSRLTNKPPGPTSLQRTPASRRGYVTTCIGSHCQGPT